MANLIVIEKTELKEFLENTIEGIFEARDRKSGLTRDETYTVNQVAKRLKMSHFTVKKLVMSGIIKSTKSGRITEQAVNDYLNDK
jgi:excisionase family DNA binding protein